MRKHIIAIIYNNTDNKIANYIVAMCIMLSMVIVVSGLSGCNCHVNSVQTISSAGLSVTYDSNIDRIIYFGIKKHHNLLYTTNLNKEPDYKGDYTFYGGLYSWIAPQSNWLNETGDAKQDWPPDPVIDRGPTFVDELGLTRFAATGPVSKRSGLREHKSVEILPNIYQIDNNEYRVAEIRHRIENISDEIKQVSIWTISAVEIGSVIAVPLPVVNSELDANDGNTIRLDSIESIPLWNLATAARDEQGNIIDNGNWATVLTGFRKPKLRRNNIQKDSFKAFIPGKPVIATWNKGYWLLRVGEQIDDSGKLWQAGEAQIEIYVNYGLKIFEAELCGPLVDLQPGGSTEFVERWYVIKSDTMDFRVLDKILSNLNR